MLTADEIIARLGLRPHPEEGGFFEFADYEHGRRAPLMRAFPAARDLIVALTRYDGGHDATS
jgi:predicted cupin superfamily sugar epimerase